MKIEVKKLEDKFIKFQLNLKSNFEKWAFLPLVFPDIEFKLKIKEFNILLEKMSKIDKLNKLMIKTTAYTDSGKTFEKELNIHTDNNEKPIISAGGWCAAYMEDFLKNYPLQQDWTIDIMGRNHGLNGESVYVKKEDVNQILKRYLELR